MYKVCQYLFSGDEYSAWRIWADMRNRYPILCGGMPPKPWVGTICEWCCTISEEDATFSPVAFIWDCPPLWEIRLNRILTMRFVSDYTYPVASGFCTMVGELVDRFGEEVCL